MDNDNEGYDSFSVNDTDLEYALNPGARRFRQTKDQQTYGIWADDDDYDARPSFGKKPSRTGGRVAFVTGGISTGSKQEKEEDLPGPSREKAEDDVVEIPLIPEKKVKKPQFGGNKKNVMSDFAGMRGPNTAAANGPNSAWASNTVMNMMKKMGWKSGKGLGKEGQGIVEPVKAILRPGRAAVGAYGNETEGLKFGESAGAAQRREGVEEEEYEDQNVEEARSNAWKKSHAGKVRPKYKTLDEIVKEGNELDQPKFVQKSSVKFIDMTGPTQKVYDNFQSFQQQVVIEQQSKRQNFNVPALTENLDHLLMSCKNEIHLNNDHLQDLKNKTAGMERDKVEIEQYVGDANKTLDKVRDVLNLVKRFENPTTTGLDVLDEYYDMFKQIKLNYPVEYQNFDLDCLIEFKVLPLMKQLFSLWNPLDSHTIEHGFEQLQKWRSILAANNDAVFDNKYDSEKTNIYDILIWHAWMPVVQRAVSTRWDPRTDSLQMIELIAIWMPILPTWIQDTLFDNVIVQKIRESVDEWDPVNDPVPIDSWIIPWHDVLGDRLLVVYPHIRQKLSRALKQWQAIDLTAIAVIKPWKKVFSHSTMQTFLKMNIVPKLEEALRQMNLNPTINSDYKEFFALLEWQDLLGQELVVEILVNNLFQRWYENLCHWLTLPNSLNDVSRYYKEWKDKVPTELVQTKAIQAEFVRALMAIKQAREGKAIVPMPSFAMQPPSNPIMPQIIPQSIPTQSQFIPTSFKQVVEHRAHELGIVYAPQPNRYHQGHIVYWFGDKSIYIDGTALFTYDTVNRSWTPISLDHLISSL